MITTQYYSLIQRYFPPEEWEHAACISAAECPPGSSGYPASCTRNAGVLQCGAGMPYVNASAYGLFGILDACWDPAVNLDSPFTHELWARRLEPEVNTWMASVIWSRSGWRAWTSCADCRLCDFRGGAIPFPRGPDEGLAPTLGAPLTGGQILLGLAFAIGGIVYMVAAKRRGA